MTEQNSNKHENMLCDGRVGSLQRKKKQPGGSWWSDFTSSKGITEILQILRIHYASAEYECVQSQYELIDVHCMKSIDLHMKV